MELNQNYPWYLQTSPSFTTLYEGVFNVAKNISPLDSYKVFYPSIMVCVGDNLAKLSGLKTYATLWQIPVEISAIKDALVYNINPWSDSYKWDGEVTGLSVDWLFRYINMKNFINQQVFCLQMIKDAFDIFFGDIDHTITVTETEYSLTINISTSDEDAEAVLTGLLTVDKTLFGKPMGATLTYIIN